MAHRVPIPGGFRESAERNFILTTMLDMAQSLAEEQIYGGE
jgi:hypothetical protein